MDCSSWQGVDLQLVSAQEDSPLSHCLQLRVALALLEVDTEVVNLLSCQNHQIGQSCCHQSDDFDELREVILATPCFGVLHLQDCRLARGKAADSNRASKQAAKQGFLAAFRQPLHIRTARLAADRSCCSDLDPRSGAIPNTAFQDHWEVGLGPVDLVGAWGVKMSLDC